ncbi:MAG: hypothetical protein QM784_39620 [Polyangiaceae bacterium]
MRWFRALSGLLVLSTMLACSAAPKSKSSGGAGDDGEGGKAQTSKGGSGAQGSSGSGGTGSGGTSATTVVEISDKMTLKEASARIVGRIGDDLAVTVTGTSEVGLVASVGLGLRKGDASPVILFDSNYDGELDSGDGRVVPETLPTAKDFTTMVKLHGVAKYEDLTTVEVKLFDRDGKATEPVSVKIEKPTISVLGEACDPSFVTSRCRQGFSCVGEPATCEEGTKPTITRGAFQRGTEGPFMRLRGVDPDEDVLFVRVDFLTDKNVPISLDLDGDEVPDATSFEVEVGIKNGSGGYVFVDEAGWGFEKLVPKVGLTAIDSRQNESTTEVYAITTRLTRQLNQTCDLDGFDICADGTVCLPGRQAGSAFCTTYAQAQSNRCAVAPVWNVQSDPKRFTGVISGYSAWDPPDGCFGSTARGRPEAVVKVHVSSNLKRLTLSTAEPETQIDTGIVVLPSCSAAPEKMLGCNDDSQGFTSSVTMTDVTAGDYFVIVESVQSDGGSFALRAIVE